MNTFGQTFASARTEDQIMAHEPIALQFGKKPYKVSPLPILKNKVWRGKMAEELNKLISSTAVPMGNMNAFMGGFMTIFFGFPEVILDLIFAYAPDLPAQEIKINATDEEVVVAFSRILAVAYPFFDLLRAMMELGKATPSASTPPR